MCLKSGIFYGDSITDKKANWSFYIAWEDIILVFMANDFYCVIPLYDVRVNGYSQKEHEGTV